MKAMRRLYDVDGRVMHERTGKIRMARLACRLSAAAISVLIAGVPAVAAQNEIDQAHVAAGRVWYEKYCTPCHGPDGGPGSAVYRVGGKAVDLRRYVARNNGIFPAHEWIAVVEHVDLTSPHAEVWEQIRTAQAGTTAQGAAARGIVALIADYSISVQTKWRAVAQQASREMRRAWRARE